MATQVLDLLHYPPNDKNSAKGHDHALAAAAPPVVAPESIRKYRPLPSITKIADQKCSAHGPI